MNSLSRLIIRVILLIDKQFNSIVKYMGNINYNNHNHHLITNNNHNIMDNNHMIIIINNIIVNNNNMKINKIVFSNRINKINN